MKAIFTCLFVSVALFGFAQQNTFKVSAFAPEANADNYSYLNKLTQLNDGSFVGVGIIYDESDPRYLNAYLLKTDATGTVLASKTIAAGSGESEAYGITKTKDGGFVVCTGTNEATVIMKFGADLTQQWRKLYETVSTDSFVFYEHIIQTNDGGYLLAGEAGSTVDETYDVYYSIIKTDGNGNVSFSKRYSTLGNKTVSGLTATTDGNYAFVAETDGGDNTLDSAELVKISSTGVLLWARYLYDSGSLNIYPDAITASSDGGLVISGEAYDYSGDVDIDQGFLAKYDNTGKLMWSKAIILPGYTESDFLSVVEDNDGGYVFGGYLFTYADGEQNEEDSSFGYAAKTNANGVMQWTRTFASGADISSSIYNLIKTADGGFAACGEGYAYRPDVDDYDDGSIIYKFNSNLTGCGDSIGSQGVLQNLAVSTTSNPLSSNITVTAIDATASLSDNGYTNVICKTTTLPLQLLSFNATLQNKSVTVQWTTANEINTSYFTVERSNNVASFSALQQVTAKGNSAGVQSYNTTDLQPLPGTSYYRLKEVDKDGKTTYSSVVPITMLNNGVVIISPNPVQNSIRVIMQNTVNASITCQVIDMKGSVLATQKTLVSSGRNEIVIPAASLVKGVYVLKVIENNTMQTIRFVKE